jgi:hypothetical protein
VNVGLRPRRHKTPRELEFFISGASFLTPIAGFFSSHHASDESLLQPLPFNFSFFGQMFDEAGHSLVQVAVLYLFVSHPNPLNIFELHTPLVPTDNPFILIY